MIDNIYEVEKRQLKEIEKEIRSAFVDFSYQNLKQHRKYSKIRTFLRSIQLFDDYIVKEGNELENKDIVILGLSCIYLASKLEDIYQIDIDEMREQMGNSKCQVHQILEQEQRIAASREYKL